jgi:hypothetical protein
MNGRIEASDTPAERLAAVCKSLALRMRKAVEARRRRPGEDYAGEPDYADYRDALAPYIDRELMRRAIEELQQFPGIPGAVFRRQDLQVELGVLEEKISGLPK